MSEERIPKRSEVPEQFKWALEDIYATDEKWAEDLQKLKAMPERIAAFKGRLILCSFQTRYLFFATALATMLKDVLTRTLQMQSIRAFSVSL